MIRLISVLLAVTYSMSLFVLPFSGLEKEFLNTDYSSSEPISNECKDSNSEGDIAPDDDEIIGQFVCSLIIPSAYQQLEKGKNKLLSISLGTPLLPPENYA